MENCNCIEKTINDNDSKRITILRFILIFFVIVLHNFFSYLSGVSFFVYAVHEPIILTMIKKLWISIIGFPNQCMTVIEFIVVPVLTALISVLFAIFLKKLIHPLFKLLNGGR